MDSKGAKRSRRIKWNKYTDFRSRRSKFDLARLCSRVSPAKLRQIFETFDQAGLLPIHWAAINNRFDLIECMLDNGSPIRVKCRNKLFSDGTELHLAAMNGSIQAASTLLTAFQSKSQQQDPKDPNQTIPKTLLSQESPVVDSGTGSDWLKERDAEGQTPLMRAAPPRSKRMDAVRELLKKNLWSLGGRPAEMALFLINKGADWRETDSLYNMNLLHLAIVNDYDDIVNMMLVIDPQLLSVAAKPKLESQRNSVNSDFTTVSLNNDSPPETASSQSSNGYTSLISRKERSDNLLEAGLTPLQLAILYGRLRIIGTLWQPSQDLEQSNRLENNSARKLGNRIEKNNELRGILFKTLWTNLTELSDLIRRMTLRVLLVLDQIVIIILFMTSHYFGWGNVVFFLSYSLSILLASRVILKDPGYTRRSSIQYMRELSSLIKHNNKDSPERKTGGRDENVDERVRLMCHRCMCLRKPRSRHCNHCQRCIQDFDHHCIYLGSCIGRYNRFDFLLLMLVMSITSLYGAILFSNQVQEDDANKWGVLDTLMLLAILKYALIGFISAFCILRRAALGVTMYEDIRSKRIRQLFGPEGAPREISRVIKIYTTDDHNMGGDSFWRYTPDRFLTGDLPYSKIIFNLREFSNFVSPLDYLMCLICSDTSLASQQTRGNDMRINLYEFV